MARERDAANNGRDVSQDALARMAIRNTQLKVGSSLPNAFQRARGFYPRHPRGSSAFVLGICPPDPAVALVECSRLCVRVSACVFLLSSCSASTALPVGQREYFTRR